jgi:hypothetical protein
MKSPLRAEEAGGTPGQAIERAEIEARRKEHEENLKAMEQRAQTTKVRLALSKSGPPAEPEPNAEARLIPRPLFEYTDQPRRILDATLWGWTSEGRLLSICKIERYDRNVQASEWLLCFGSLSSGLVEAEWQDGHHWSARKPGMELAPIGGAPDAAQGMAARLRQMKDIAKRFDATMIDGPDKRQQMRLLPRPLYRYEEPAGDLRDGAVFGLTSNGTNPDAVLVVELHRAQAPAPEWKFGVTGMTTSALSVRFDDKEVWTKPSSPAMRSYENWVWFWENQR